MEKVLPIVCQILGQTSQTTGFIWTLFEQR
jgi:hypothetical protein